MGAIRWAVLAVLAGAATACGDDAPSDADTGGAPAEIEVVIDEGTTPIARLRDVRCRRVDDTQLVAEGVVASNGDDTHYVSLQVRFVDDDGVRVELATDSVSDLRVGESARWDASTYADGARDVRRCEVTATVS